MYQGHGADSEIVVDAEYGQIVVDLMAAFYSENRCDFSGFGDAFDVGGVEGERDLIGMRVENALHCVAQVERAAYGVGSFVVSGNPESEERCVDAAFTEAWEIDVAAG